MATISSNSMYGVSILLKSKNAEAWSDSEVLLEGELGIELDTTQWSELDYYSDPVVSGLVSALTERVSTNEGSITALDTRLTAAEGVNTTQGTDITALQGRMTDAENVNTTQQADIDAIKGITVISANPAPAAGNGD